jgi:hypothetical protein
MSPAGSQRPYIEHCSEDRPVLLDSSGGSSSL